MIIDEIEMWAVSELGVSAEEFVSFSLSQVDQTQSYILEQAVGLDPDQITPVFAGSWTEGAIKEEYFEMKLPPRSIGLKIKLNPQLGASETYSSLREHLYKIISRARTGKVELRLKYNDTIVATIQGLVNRVESSLFDTDPKIQLSIGCQDPFLKGPEEILYPSPTYTYPADFDWTIDDDVSTAPHGFRMKITVGAYDVDSLTIQTVTGYDNLALTVNKTFQEDDEIFFSSEENNKYLYFVRGSSTTYLTDKIESGAVWPRLFPGENNFHLNAPTQEELFGYTVRIDYIKHYPHYWGV